MEIVSFDLEHLDDDVTEQPEPKMHELADFELSLIGGGNGDIHLA